MRKRTALAVFIFFLAAVVPPCVRAEDAHIGIVDIMRVIDLSKQGKKATEEITSRLTSAKGDLEKRQAELVKMKQDIESQAMTLSAEVLAKKERTYQDRYLEYQRRLEDYEYTLNEKNSELNRTIVALMKDVIEKIGIEGGYQLILERTTSGVLYYSGAVDLTDRVIEQLDKK